MSGTGRGELFEPARPWWQLYPDVWDAELAAFAAAGLTWHEVRHDGLGVAVAGKFGTVVVPAGSAFLAGTPAQGTAVALLVGYPSSYPWFPPSVWLTGGQLPWLSRHRGGDHRLCLMHDEHWRPGMTAAGLLTAQLPLLLTTAAPDAEARLGRDRLAVLEVQGAEPSAIRAATGGGWSFLVDSAWEVPATATCGHLLIACTGGPGAAGQLRVNSPGYVARVYDRDGGALAGLPVPLLPSPYLPVAGRWLLLEAPPPLCRPEELFEQVRTELPDTPQVPVEPLAVQVQELARDVERAMSDEQRQDARRLDALTQLRVDGERAYLSAWRQFHGRVEVIGLLHPDETTWRSTGWAWTFLIRHRTNGRHRWVTSRARAGYAGAEDLHTRAPHAIALTRSRVAVVGAGAIGSRVAEALAQAAVGTLTVIDRDVLQAGNLTRHTCDMRQVGYPKAEAIADHLKDRAPITDVRAFVCDIGSTSPAENACNGHGFAQDVARTHDLVIDATADEAVSRYLAALCLAQGTTFLHVSATAGAWGGVVVRIDPATTPGCWSCLEHHRADGTVPVPPADPAAGALQPIGCTSPTFTGAAAELDTIALAGVRVAVSALRGNETQGAFGTADVFAATLRTPDGPIPGRWQQARLAIHSACPVHGGAASAATVQTALVATQR